MEQGAAATERQIDLRKKNETLKCLLTADEIREAGENLARLISSIEDLESEKRSLMSDFKARIDSASAERDMLARKIGNRYEFRAVECEEIWDYDTKTVSVVRQDTGETVRERTMTADELQKGLFG